MLNILWTQRTQPALASVAWFKIWAKRIQQAPRLFTYVRARRSLLKQGAAIDVSAVFANPTLITGRHLDLSVGAETFIGRVKIAVHAPVTIGRRVCINDGAILLTASHDIRHPNWPTVAKPIHVEDYAWIATNAILLPGVTIGRGAVVAAGAVVSRDVPSGAVASGNPAHITHSQRATGLDYSPTASLALFTAWMGSPQTKA